MMGVLIFLAALIISLIRGTPSVTFIDATPAKWKVFKVICVPGSPMDCAPTAPTVEPGSIFAFRYFVRHSSRKYRSWSSVTLTRLSTILISASVEIMYKFGPTVLLMKNKTNANQMHPWIDQCQHPILLLSPRRQTCHAFSALQKELPRYCRERSCARSRDKPPSILW